MLRLLAVTSIGLALWILTSCDGGDSPSQLAPEPSSTAPAELDAQQCFAEGRHLGVESAARTFIASYLNPQRVPIRGYEVGATLITPTSNGARFEMEYLVHGASGTVPVLFVATVDVATCVGELVEVNGHHVSSYSLPTPTPATGEHCVRSVYTPSHLGFERLVRDAVTEQLASEGATIDQMSFYPGTIEPERAGWHAYQVGVHVSFSHPDRILGGERIFYADGAIHTDDCRARLDWVR